MDQLRSILPYEWAMAANRLNMTQDQILASTDPAVYTSIGTPVNGPVCTPDDVQTLTNVLSADGAIPAGAQVQSYDQYAAASNVYAFCGTTARVFCMRWTEANGILYDFQVQPILAQYLANQASYHWLKTSIGDLRCVPGPSSSGAKVEFAQ